MRAASVRDHEYAFVDATQAMALSSVALVPEAPAWAVSHQPSKALVLQADKVA